MIVECHACNTIFPVDPLKVPAGGVHARCSVCNEVFFVSAPEPEPDFGEEMTSQEEEATTFEEGEMPETEAPFEEGEVSFEGTEGSELGIEAEAEESPGLPPEEGADEETLEVVEEAAGEPEQTFGEADQTFGEPEQTFGEAEQTFGEAEQTFGEAEQTFGEAEQAFGEAEQTFGEAEAAVEEVAEEVEAASEVADTTFEEVETAYEEVDITSGEEAAGVADAIGSVVDTPPISPPLFGKRDPQEKAQRLARVLVSDIILYNPDRHHSATETGRVKEEFEEEIQKSWNEYVEQVGEEVANSTDFFNDALNEILAKGERIF